MIDENWKYSWYWSKRAHEYIEKNEGLCAHTYTEDKYDSITNYIDRLEYLKTAFSIHVHINLKGEYSPNVSVKCIPVHLANRLEMQCSRVFDKVESHIREEIIFSQIHESDSEDG